MVGFLKVGIYPKICFKNKIKILLFITSGKPGQRPERHSCCLPLPQEKKQNKYFGLMHIFHQIAEISSNWSKTMNSVVYSCYESAKHFICIGPAICKLMTNRVQTQDYPVGQLSSRLVQRFGRDWATKIYCFISIICIDR